jgi:hypothetical protein
MVSVRSALHVTFLLGGAVIVILLFHRLGPQNIVVLLRQLGWSFLGALAVYTIHLIVRAVALSYCFTGTRLRFGELLYIRFVNEAVRGLTLTGPFLSEPATAWFIAQRGVRTPEAAAATIAEYVAHTFMSMLLTIPAALYCLKELHLGDSARVALLILLSGSSVLVVSTVCVFWRGIHVVSHFVPSIETVRRTEDALFPIFRDNPRNTLRLAGIEIVAHTLLIIETYWILTAMNLTHSFGLAALVEILSKLAGLGSIGTTEGAYALLFIGLALPPAAGFALSLVKRIRSLAITVIGLAGVAILPYPTTSKRVTNS